MPSAGRALGAVLACGLLFYPVLVYSGLHYVGPRWLALALLLLVLMRLLLVKKVPNMAAVNSYWLLVAALVACGATLASGSLIGLKFYPVLVSAILLVVFALSLLQPPSIIERLARLQQPELPPHAIVYTRRVTQVWCGFFVINGAIALASVFASEQWWALYNGLISYLAMGVLMAAEYGVRRRVMRKHSADNPAGVSAGQQ